MMTKMKNSFEDAAKRDQKVMVEQLADNVTLYCGDSAEVLPTLKKAHKIDAVVTDPPYGISMDKRNDSEANQKHGWSNFAGVPQGWDKKRPPQKLIQDIVGLGKPTIIWGGNYFIDWLAAGTKWLIWDKMQEDFSLADAELAWCSFDGAIRRIGVSRGHALQDGKEHPTQKSLKVMQWCIDQQLPDPKAKIILDPFCGSGTTGVAAVSLGRGFVGIEKEPHYFEVSLRRIKKELSQDKLF